MDSQIMSSAEISGDFMEEAALKLRLEKYLGLGVFEKRCSNINEMFIVKNQIGEFKKGENRRGKKSPVFLAPEATVFPSFFSAFYQ